MYAIDPYANLGFFAVHTINRRAQKKSPPDHGKALRFLFSLLRGLRRAVCGLVSAIAAAARALGRVRIRGSLRSFALGLLHRLLLALRLALLILARGARLLVVRPLFALRLTRLLVGLLRRLLGGFTLRSCFRRTFSSLAAASSSAAAAILTGWLVARFRLLQHLRR